MQGILVHPVCQRLRYVQAHQIKEMCTFTVPSPFYSQNFGFHGIIIISVCISAFHYFTWPLPIQFGDETAAFAS